MLLLLVSLGARAQSPEEWIKLGETVHDVPAETPARDQRRERGGGDDLDRGGTHSSHDQRYREW